MAHSVSHNLILVLNGSDFAIATVKKDGMVMDFQLYPETDKSTMENLLSELPDIYSDMTLIVRKKDFILVPENFYADDLKELFKLSYDLLDEEEVFTDKLDQGLGIVYPFDTELAASVTSKFPRIKIRHEASVILKKLFKEVNFKQPRILISINHENLIIFAVNEGKLLLCNSYPSTSNDDIFYFVMLAIEQLHFLPAETELVILGEPPVRSEIFQVFKNYISEINIWMEEYQSDPEIKNPELLSQFFALQVLVCE